MKHVPLLRGVLSLNFMTSLARFAIDEDPQKFNSPTSKYIFSATNGNIEKASHKFVVHHLLIDIVQFVWSYVRAGRQVIQFSK